MSKHLEVWFQLCTPHPPQLQKKKMFDPNFKLNKLGNYRAGDMKQRRGQVEVIPGETQPRVDPKPPCPYSQVSIPRGSVPSACGSSLCSRRPTFTAWLPQVTSAFRLSSPLRGLSILPFAVSHPPSPTHTNGIHSTQPHHPRDKAACPHPPWIPCTSLNSGNLMPRSL